VRCPDSFRAFTVSQSSTRDAVEGIALMFRALVHRFVDFWDCWNEGCQRRWLERHWPVDVDMFAKVDEPLASNIIADDHKRHCNPLQYRGEHVVHVGIPDNDGQSDEFKDIIPNITHLSPF